MVEGEVPGAMICTGFEAMGRPLPWYPIWLKADGLQLLMPPVVVVLVGWQMAVMAAEPGNVAA